MTGINDISYASFGSPTPAAVQPNALADSWGGAAARGGGFGSWMGGYGNQQGQGQDGGQNAYPDWRRWLSMRQGGGLSRPMGNAQAPTGAPMQTASASAPTQSSLNALAAAPGPAPAQAKDPNGAMNNLTTRAATPAGLLWYNQ